jgi:hypothetical protein
VTSSSNSLKNNVHRAEGSGTGAGASSPFCPSAMVLVTLHSPREKFWGSLVELNPAGGSVCGVPLDSVDDCILQLKAGERIDGSVVFFPMHRIERMELDTRNGEIPSLSERFESKTGVHPTRVFQIPEVRG